MSTTVAIQGQTASFHDLAARQFFGDDVQIVPCDTFAETFAALKTSNYAVVAIENSLFGSINKVYDLLLKEAGWIVGEVYLRIEQCLIGLPEASLKEITEVHSQLEAIAQCEEFLDSELPQAKRLEHHDTAASVEAIKNWGDPHKAAIASRAAAELHHMAILAPEIETNKQNYTRFVVVQKAKTVVEDANKTSLVLRTHGDTRPGALHHALGVFAKRNLNMTMLHSRPVVGKAWHYMFYIDLEISSEDPQFSEVMKELADLGCDVALLGSYRSGAK
jgi:prephenate dehydratase